MKTLSPLVAVLRSVGGTFDGAAAKFVSCKEAADEIESLWEQLSAAMLLLAEVEPHLDEWNFPITLNERVTAFCNAHFGEGERPDP